MSSAETTGRKTEIFLESYPPPSRRAPFVLAAYPNTYRVGMSNLGLHFLFRELSRPGIFRVERHFTDSKPPAHKPQIVFATISYEEDLINLVKMLRDLGIEPSREDRGGDPLVIAGGAAVSANPLPVSPIADAVALGEGESALREIIEALSGVSHPAGALPLIDRTEQVFVPALGGRSSASGRSAPEDFQRSVILTPDTVFADTLLVEISRGCPGRCSFCLATAVYDPFRPVPAERIEEIIESAAGRARKVGLVSTAAAAHPDFERIMEYLSSRSIAAGISSLRAADLDGASIRLIAGSGVRSVALAPESGSERVRRLAGKGVGDDVFVRTVSMLAEAGVARISLYLIAGLPGGGDGEIGETEAFMAAMKKAAGRTRLAAHLNALVPKAGTPLQYHPLPPLKELEETMRGIESACRGSGVPCETKSLRSSMRQAVLSLGGEETGRALLRLAAGRVSWKKALRGEGADPALPFRERGMPEPLPWDRFYSDEARAGLARRYMSLRAGDHESGPEK